MLLPIFFHKSLKTEVDPVKCNPENSGWDNAISEIIFGSPVIKFMTPSGNPASRKMSIVILAV